MAECPYRFNLPKKERACIQHACEFYTNVQGKNPQGQDVINRWGCAIAWLPIMLVENAQRQMQTGAETHLVAEQISKATELVALAMQRADVKASQTGLSSDKGRLLQGDKKAKKIDLKENGHGS